MSESAKNNLTQLVLLEKKKHHPGAVRNYQNYTYSAPVRNVKNTQPWNFSKMPKIAPHPWPVE